MGWLKFVSVMLCVIVLTACSGVSRVPLALHGGEVDGKVMVQTTVSDPHAFAPTTQRSWMEVCDYKKTEDHQEVYSNCDRAGIVQFTTQSGYLDGLGSAALYSASIVGGAALIGNGISKSGSVSTTNTSQTGGGATVEQTQSQHQSGYQKIEQPRSHR